MSPEDGPADAPSADGDEDGPADLAAALNVRHNARVGVGAGAVVGALLYLWLQAGLGWALTDTAVYYLSLAFVAAASVAFVVAVALCAKAGLDPVLDRANWLRRGGSAAVVGGLVWASLPAVAWLAAAGVLGGTTWRQATILAALVLAAGAAGLHAAVRDATGAPERGVYAAVLGGLLIAAGNASGDPGPIVETPVGPLATPFLLGAFLAYVASVPLAAVVGFTGRLPSWGARGLIAGSVAAAAGVGWLVLGGGWPLLVDAVATPDAAALAVATVPSGLGWVAAGLALREYALALGGDRDPEREAAASPAG